MIRCAALRSSTVPRYIALNNMLRYAAPRYASLCGTVLRFFALHRATLRYSVLF